MPQAGPAPIPHGEAWAVSATGHCLPPHRHTPSFTKVWLQGAGNSSLPTIHLFFFISENVTS